MKLTFDTLSSTLIVSPGHTVPVSRIAAQRGESEYIALELVQDGARVQLPDASFTFAAKLRYNDESPVVIAETWGWNADLQIYEAAVNYDVDALNNLLLIGEAKENDKLHLKGQFAMLRPSLGGWRKSQVVDFILHNDVWRGAGDPVPPVPGVLRPMIKAISGAVTNGTTTLEPVTGLTFPVSAGKAYSFRFQIPYATAAGSVGSVWIVTAPGTGALNYVSRCSNGDSAERVLFSSNASLPGATANSAASGNIAILEGVCIPDASGEIGVSFASESASNVIALSGANVTYCEMF